MDPSTALAVSTGAVPTARRPVWIATVMFVALRLGQMAVTLLVSSFVTFALLRLAPGNPITMILGSQSSNHKAVAALRERFLLDQPLLVQYGHWLGNAIHGNLGESYLYRDSVSSMVADRLPTTLFLVLYGGILVIVFGFFLGLWAARSSRAVDTGISTFLAVAMATPSYVIAIILITIFSLYLNWFPVFGSGHGFVDRLYHLTLPAIALALGASAAMARITRASIIEEAGRDHVLTARARGFGSGYILRRHIVRNALLPVTTIAGLTIASLIAGTFIVEQAFGLDGIGSLLVLAITRDDYPTVQSISFLIMLAFLVMNAIVDVLYTLLDPRTRAVAR
ncbi:MAG: ABC transporter permease [Lacisediminihabitans sp.]